MIDTNRLAVVGTEANDIGRVTAEVLIANNDEVGAERRNPGSVPVMKLRLQAVVDTGATRLVLPEKVARELKLIPAGTVTVRYADHRTSQRPMVKEVWLSLLGREGVFSAVIEPDRDAILLGAIVLEELDLLVDCTLQRLIPRDPERIVAEIE